MNPARLLIIIVFGYSFLGCRHQPAQDQSIMRICDEKNRLLLREYLRQPKYYQDQDFIEEFLDAISRNDSNATNRLEKKILEVKQAIEMDSLWRFFTEESDFEQNEYPTEVEQYRLTIFTDPLDLIEIYRIEKEKTSSKLFYKKIRLVCEPPIISGKALEKSCFKIIHSVKHLVSESEAAAIKAIIHETAFWDLPRLYYDKSYFDGPFWKLEILKDGHYRQMRSYCPGKYDPVYLIGSQMIALTK